MRRLLLTAAVVCAPAGLPAADILFLAGPDTHAWGQHKHYAGSMLLADSLRAALPKLTTEVVREFPSTDQLSAARGLVIYADGHQFHPANAKLPELEAFLKAGKGVTVLHWATGIAEVHSPLWRTLVGAGFESGHSVSRIWTGDFSAANNPHPVLRGTDAFRLHDECYFHLNFASGPGLDQLLAALPPADLLEPSGEHAFEGNSKVRASVIGQKEPQAVAWAYTRPQGGRAFGFTGGHFHWSWARNDVRRLALNGIAWTAGLEIPDKGLESPVPTAAKMLENLSGTNPGWTVSGLQTALDKAGRGEVVAWKAFESKPLAAEPVAAAKPSLKEGNAADAPKLSAEEQQQQFVVADGFSIELVTSEVQGTEKPVALNFDAAGRLWTMTATEYPLDTNDKAHADEARRKWQEGGQDRILVIDDPLKAGPHTPRVFADGLVMPMSVLPYQNGAIVAHGPEILMLRDRDGDGKADERRVLLKGFGIQDSHTLAHQLMWRPDGSIFTAQGVLDNGGITDTEGKSVSFNYGKFASFRPDGTGFRIIGAGLNNTWGVLMRRNGEIWVQEANSFDHPIAPFEEGAHYHGWNEEPYIKDAPWQPGVGEVDLGSTGLSGLAQSEDRAGGFPPEWQSRMLIANAVTGAINAVTAERKPGGGWKVTRGPDLVMCKDRRFRPVHIAFGPDACLYIVDWYNPVISHNEVPRDHPARDKVSGRIWRVRHSSQTNREAPNVQSARDTKLVGHLKSANTWEMRAAWREIVERKAAGLTPELKTVLRDSSLPDDVRIHALWCLAELRHFDGALWSEVLEQRSGTDPANLRPTSEDLKVELVRSLRTIQPSSEESEIFQHAIGNDASLRLRTEFARWLHDTPDVSAVELSIALRWLKDVPPAKVPGVQGETPSWADYPQAFLNMWIERTMDRQKGAVEQLARNQGILASIPSSARAMIERAGYTKRFEGGSVSLDELDAAPLRFAALSCAESSPKAAALLREYVAKSPYALNFAGDLLESESVTPAALKAFAAPLALRCMAEADRVDNGLDLAALACSPADSEDFVRLARTILTKRPEKCLHVLRSAVTAGIRSVELYGEYCTPQTTDAAVLAVAVQGLFDSAAAGDKPKAEAQLRVWAAKLTPQQQTTVLTELAATTTGTHFALNNVFPGLLAQDATILPRFADELSERVPAHGRLPKLQEIVNRQRMARMDENVRRIATVEKLTGDKAAGEPFFTSLCLACHSVGGKGLGFAPPLDGSRQRDLPAVLLALMEPEAAVENVFRPFHIRMRDGTELEGFLKARSGNRVTIQLMGGATLDVHLLRSYTARYRNGHSVMPPFAASLTDQQISDLAAFVRGL